MTTTTLARRLQWGRWGAVLVLLLVVGAVLSGCGRAAAATGSPTTGNSTSAATQTNEGGEVIFRVTWQGPEGGPVFKVAMDTHSVDLDGYDLGQLAVLRADDGRELQPSAWEAPKGGHHRTGTLTFPTTGDDGKAVVGPDTPGFELIIRDVAGVPERVLRWTQ